MTQENSSSSSTFQSLLLFPIRSILLLLVSLFPTTSSQHISSSSSPPTTTSLPSPLSFLLPPVYSRESFFCRCTLPQTLPPPDELPLYCTYPRSPASIPGFLYSYFIGTYFDPYYSLIASIGIFEVSIYTDLIFIIGFLSITYLLCYTLLSTDSHYQFVSSPHSLPVYSIVVNQKTLCCTYMLLLPLSSH